MAHFRNDVGEARLRSERVARNGDIDAVRARTLRDERKAFLLVALPVAAVDEHEQRRVLGAARKVVERGARPRAVAQIEPRWLLGADRGAQVPPALAIILHVGDRAGVVIGGVERRPIHAAVDRGHLNAIPPRGLARDDW